MASSVVLREHGEKSTFIYFQGKGEHTEKTLAAAPVGSKVVILLLLHIFVSFIVLLSSF